MWPHRLTDFTEKLQGCQQYSQALFLVPSGKTTELKMQTARSQAPSCGRVLYSGTLWIPAPPQASTRTEVASRAFGRRRARC